MTTRRIDLLGVDELAEGEMRMVWVDETDPVLVVHINGEFHAMQGTCSHEYYELDRGFLTAGTLTCPLHMSRFDLSDGEALDPPAELPLAVYPVEIVDGRVTIEVGDGPARAQRGDVGRWSSISRPSASSCGGSRRTISTTSWRWTSTRR